MNNPIDDLIDQINDSEESNTCSKCLCQSKYLFKMSCTHFICLECVELLINENNYKSCPLCAAVLQKNLHKIYGTFLIDPVAKLSYYHGINIGDVLWYYGGNGHNWLYSKDQCQQLTTAYNNYKLLNGENSTELQIQIGNNFETYVIDFDSNTQYPKNTPNKQRDIFHFTFKVVADLKRNKIIGITGKPL